jgi:hypothetical protein
MQRLFLDADGKPWFVSDSASKRSAAPWTPAAAGASR